MSAIASVIADMVRAGVDPDLIGRAAEAFAERIAIVDEQAERRRARDRARKAAKVSDFPRNSAESAEQKKGPRPQKKTPIPPLKGGTFPTTDPLEKPIAEPAKALTEWVSEIWDQTPLKARQRSSRRETETALRAAVKRGATPAEVKACLAAYYASPDATKDAGAFAKGLHRMIADDRWRSYEPQAPPSMELETDPWPSRMLGWNRGGYWNSEWGPKPGRVGYLGPPEREIAA